MSGVYTLTYWNVLIEYIQNDLLYVVKLPVLIKCNKCKCVYNFKYVLFEVNDL